MIIARVNNFRDNLKLPGWVFKLTWIAMKSSQETRAHNQVPRMQNSSSTECDLDSENGRFELEMMRVKTVSCRLGGELCIVWLAAFCLKYWWGGYLFSSVIHTGSVAFLTLLQKTRALEASLVPSKYSQCQLLMNWGGTSIIFMTNT